MVIAGVVDAFATDPAKPFAVTTEAEVTVPVPPAVIVAQVLSPRRYVVEDGVPVAVKFAIPTEVRESVPAVAAEIDVPFPFNKPVIVVEIVIAGVEVAVATVPANPLAEVTETVVTVPTFPVATVAQVLSPRR